MKRSDRDGWCREYVRSYSGACRGRISPQRIWAPNLRLAMERTSTGDVFPNGGGDISTRVDCVASGEYVVFRFDRSAMTWVPVDDTFRGGAR